jgi:hypothetical protein
MVVYDGNMVWLNASGTLLNIVSAARVGLLLRLLYVCVTNGHQCHKCLENSGPGSRLAVIENIVVAS